MFELLLLILGMLVLPIVVNKTTEKGRFDWIHQHLRWIWTVIFAFVSLYLLEKPIAREAAMRIKESLCHVSPVWGYVVCGIVGASILCGYWWFSGKIIPSEQGSGMGGNLKESVAQSHPVPMSESRMEPTEPHHSTNGRELEPIIVDEFFSVMIPYSTDYNVLIPGYEPQVTDGNGPMVLDDISSRYGRLRQFAVEWLAPDGRPETFEASKPSSTDGPWTLLAEALQFYIIEQIDYIESDSSGVSVTPGVAATPFARMGIHPPNMVRYPGDQFLKSISSNRIATTPYHSIARKARGYKVPRATMVVLENKLSNTAAHTFLFALRNPLLYTLEIIIEPTGGSNLR